MKIIAGMTVMLLTLAGSPAAGASLAEVASLIPTGLEVSETTVYRVVTSVNDQADTGGHLEYWALPAERVAILGYRDGVAVSCRMFQKGIPQHPGRISSLSLLFLTGNRFFGLIDTLTWQDTGVILEDTAISGLECYQVTVPGPIDHRRVLTIARESGIPLAVRNYRGDACVYALAIEIVPSPGALPKLLAELLARSDE